MPDYSMPACIGYLALSCAPLFSLDIVLITHYHLPCIASHWPENIRLPWWSRLVNHSRWKKATLLLSPGIHINCLGIFQAVTQTPHSRNPQHFYLFACLLNIYYKQQFENDNIICLLGQGNLQLFICMSHDAQRPPRLPRYHLALATWLSSAWCCAQGIHRDEEGQIAGR